MVTGSELSDSDDNESDFAFVDDDGALDNDAPPRRRSAAKAKAKPKAATVELPALEPAVLPPQPIGAKSASELLAPGLVARAELERVRALARRPCPHLPMHSHTPSDRAGKVVHVAGAEPGRQPARNHIHHGG